MIRKLPKLKPLKCARKASLGAAMLVLAACSTAAPGVDVHDPYESVNRATHTFNAELDRSAVRPASQVYGTLVPSPVRQGVDNVASTFGLPSIVMNDLLQGEIQDAVHNTARMAVNLTFGFLGLLDPATEMGLDERSNDFGATLAAWGADEGAYLVLPIFGPSTERDAAGLIVDAITNPVGTVLSPSLGQEAEDAELSLTAATTLNSRYELTDTIDNILYESEDSYTQLRLFYLDSRRFALGQSTPGASDDLYDDLYGDLYDE